MNAIEKKDNLTSVKNKLEVIIQGIQNKSLNYSVSLIIKNIEEILRKNIEVKISYIHVLEDIIQELEDGRK